MAGTVKLAGARLARSTGHGFRRFLAQNGEETQGFLTFELLWRGESS
jgi:hypothetical protein